MPTNPGFQSVLPPGPTYRRAPYAANPKAGRGRFFAEPPDKGDLVKLRHALSSFVAGLPPTVCTGGDTHIDDAAFATEAAELLVSLIEARKHH